MHPQLFDIYLNKGLTSDIN